MDSEKTSAMRGGDTLPELLARCGRYVSFHTDSTRGQGSIMKIISERREITQSELLKLLEIKPGSLSELLTRLERRGFIERRRDPDDRRCVTVLITAEGQHEAQRHSIINEDTLFAGLSPEEREELRQLLKKLSSGWGFSRGARRCRNEKGE